MTKSDLIIIMLGVIAICCSRLIKISTNITKNNNTINMLYSENKIGFRIRTQVEKIKVILSYILLLCGAILVFSGIIGLN